MTARAQVSISDLLVTLRALQISSVPSARAVLGLLGLEGWQVAGAVPPEAGLPAVRLQGTDALAPDVPAPAPGAAAPYLAQRGAMADPPAPPTGGDAGPWQLIRLPPASPAAPPAWAASTPPLARAVRAKSPQPEPLFQPRQERALLGALGASRNPDGALDMPRLLQALASGTLLQALPLQAAWGTRRGLQVLVDDAPGMAPFRADVEQLLLRLCALLPNERLHRLQFEGCPTRGCRQAGQRGSLAWQPPERGCPVLLLSDLGLAAADPPAARGRHREWLAFARLAQAAGVQLRTLLPYPASRWPAALVGRLHPIAWDRRTSVAQVRRAAAAGARGSGA